MVMITDKAEMSEYGPCSFFNVALLWRELFKILFQLFLGLSHLFAMKEADFFQLQLLSTKHAVRLNACTSNSIFNDLFFIRFPMFFTKLSNERL